MELARKAEIDSQFVNDSKLREGGEREGSISPPPPIVANRRFSSFLEDPPMIVLSPQFKAF